ncbi:hypothetical protein CF319_g9190 [Tilletia indica]|uniref:Uncharacterized protein n=1 Tax=Tilletia indica TaxID=43049 RepID=A0A177T827_9BASI|nr:hypothetical protein CF319_g9190 [Tilletia indica]KAE8239028.1 hypothetical protein A4X13_0g8279 [Tilletia indica]
MLALWAALAILGFIWMLGRIRELRDSARRRSTSDMTIAHPTPTPGEKDGYVYEMDDIAVGHRWESQPPLTGDGSQRAPLNLRRGGTDGSGGGVFVQENPPEQGNQGCQLGTDACIISPVNTGARLNDSRALYIMHSKTCEIPDSHRNRPWRHYVLEGPLLFIQAC